MRAGRIRLRIRALASRPLFHLCGRSGGGDSGYLPTLSGISRCLQKYLVAVARWPWLPSVTLSGISRCPDCTPPPPALSAPVWLMTRPVCVPPPAQPPVTRRRPAAPAAVLAAVERSGARQPKYDLRSDATTR